MADTPSGYMSDTERKTGQTGQTGQAAQRAKERVSDMAGQARETINRASRGMNETWDQAMVYSKDHPATATLVAFGAGVGVGLCIAGTFGVFQSRGRARRMVPPIMNALSDIAREFFR